MFVLLFILWVLFNGRLNVEIALFGIVLSAAVYAFSCAFLGYSWKKDLRTLCAIPKGLRYLALLLKEVVKSNIALTRMVYGRREPKPRLVTFRTPLEGNARSVLADSITLTPGTITVSIEENKMTVHALDEAFAEGIEDTDFQKALLKMQRKEERA